MILIHLAEQLTSAAGAGADRSKDIPPILRALWKDIVSPIVGHLAAMGVPVEFGGAQRPS